MNRYTNIDFPPYKFVPGHGKHPEKEGGYLKGHEIKSQELTQANFRTHEIYLYAIDLFNHGHFWDAHVYWEVLWNLTGRKGEEADFLKGLIKVAAAGVKFQLNQIEPARDHLARAQELFGPLPQTQFGLSVLKYINEVQKSFPEFNLEFLYSIPLKLENE